eukprot:TRINITY_DN11630_c0_g1_i2.p1 TRINITY_DN11630_c0_g1~~TRINITY_DN11630_c0_g1_i2.p1  ORF type:complete len:200 (-),score=36.59 TRINITY_DN11630_c0_g1_i2:20-619(-)
MIAKRTVYTYEHLWKDYGVTYDSLSCEAQQYFLNEVLKRCSLYIPLEVEEKMLVNYANINMKPLTAISFHRELIGSEYKFPLTLTLLSCRTEISGIKAVLYNNEEVKEDGVFFMVNPEDWECPEEKKIAPKKNQKDEIPENTLLPEKLKKRGYKVLIGKLKFNYNQQKVPRLQYVSKKGPTSIEQLESIFANTKKHLIS